ncbi:hypothetical protein [Nocardioides sp.]|uniref:hypothetical protein n=1 Tax=Nocardioides sp. TaxID=35761 RepID=UPI002BCC0563|nr:hypothetical protein [Nocardioides sp.]HXH76929.1 hypothetical protein [Nocardioides sp.]
MTASLPDSSELAFHDWQVEEREVRRHIPRRGRQHAFEVIDPRRTALVVIDMVPFFLDESAYCRGIVANINTLAETAEVLELIGSGAIA